MPRTINEEKFYTMIDVCRAAGISRSTLIRWLRKGSIPHDLPRDKRGWRLFDESDLIQIKNEANEIK
jgi:predicted site-specific integrase-resolvase